MPGKIFLVLLILCGIWSQGIIGTLVDEKIHEASDVLVRQKRVISYVPGEDIPTQISDAPHVVIVKQYNNIECLANVLSRFAAITAAACVPMQPDRYQISSRTGRVNRGSPHNVTGISRFYGDHPGREEDGIALFTVDPPFLISAYCRIIPLYIGPLLPGTSAAVSGWGYFFRGVNQRGTNNATQLRTIRVPIISQQECINRYRPHIVISDKDICTFHPQRHCGHSDGGAGLVVNGALAGVFLHSGTVEGQINPRYPDVFALLQDREYYEWIRTKLASIHSRHGGK